MASRATFSASSQRWSGIRSSAPPKPPCSPNSVRTGPGHTDVTVTPVPRISSCSASLRLSTNAFVAP